MTPPPGVCLLNNNVLLLSPHKHQQKARDGEEDGVHDPERKTRLQHRARLVYIQTEWARAAKTIGAEADVGAAISREAGAILARNVA